MAEYGPMRQGEKHCYFPNALRILRFILVNDLTWVPRLRRDENTKRKRLRLVTICHHRYNIGNIPHRRQVATLEQAFSHWHRLDVFRHKLVFAVFDKQHREKQGGE